MGLLYKNVVGFFDKVKTNHVIVEKTCYFGISYTQFIVFQ